MTETLIQVDGVSKKFCRDLKRSLWYGLQDISGEMLCREASKDALRKEEFWALKDISFELKRQECLGLIGKNGAGKTTLLKLIHGLIKPDQGQITLRGRMSALIALGAGFNPILTGRENIYVGASVLGLNKAEIDQKIDEIIDFAEIWDFIDTPVQSYSTGMQVRLGFAIATALEPDILILDEVLAVGDLAFRSKCYNRIGELRQKAAVILVSHHMDQIVQTCTHTLLLKEGQCYHAGDVQTGVKTYYEINHNLEGQSKSEFERLSPSITSVSVRAEANSNCLLEAEPAVLTYNNYLKITLEFEADQKFDNITLRFAFYNVLEQFVAEWHSKFQNIELDIQSGKNQFVVDIGPINLKAGHYKISTLVHDHTGIYSLVWLSKSLKIFIEGEMSGHAPCQLNSASDVAKAVRSDIESKAK